MKIELKDTIEFMNSKDYKERFVAEYLQTKIRYEKLKKFNQRITVGQMRGLEKFEPEHDCPLNLLLKQQQIMRQLLDILEQRAIIEDIDLEQIIVNELIANNSTPVEIRDGRIITYAR